MILTFHYIQKLKKTISPHSEIRIKLEEERVSSTRVLKIGLLYRFIEDAEITYIEAPFIHLVPYREGISVDNSIISSEFSARYRWVFKLSEEKPLIYDPNKKLVVNNIIPIIKGIEIKLDAEPVKDPGIRVLGEDLKFNSLEAQALAANLSRIL